MASSFRLQAVLEHRQRLEDRCRQQLAAALQCCQQLQQQYQQLTDRCDSLASEYAQRQQAGMTIADLLLYENGLNTLREERVQLGLSLKKAQDQIVRCREELAEASRNKKLLEKLKDKKMLEAKHEQLRQEMLQLDEVALRFRNGEEP